MTTIPVAPLPPVTVLVELPCGCVVEIGQDNAHVNFVGPDGYVLCPWCEATFDLEVLYDWFSDGCSNPVKIQMPSRTILAAEGEVVEVAGKCECGCLLVRRLNTTKKLHLNPNVNVEMLKN